MYVRHDLCLRYLNHISVFIFSERNLFFFPKITVSEKNFFLNLVLNIIYAFYFHCYNNVTNTHERTNVSSALAVILHSN